MSAYLHTVIDGNKNFGGYLSVDGAKSFAINDDMTYELTPGHHALMVYSVPDFQRKSGKLQATLYTHTSSNGAVLDMLEAQSAIRNMGDGWEINIMVDDRQMVELNILSQGSKIVGDPMYAVSDLSEKEVNELEERFDAWRNTPIRSKKKMIWGAILAFLGIYGTTGMLQQSPVEIGGLLGMLGLAVAGVLLFVFGFRKKIRRQ